MPTEQTLLIVFSLLSPSHHFTRISAFGPLYIGYAYIGAHLAIEDRNEI